MKPMLCHVGDVAILKKKGYFFEPKLDGVRMLLHKKNKSVTLTNRNGVNKTAHYPELQELNIKNGCVLDGEVVVYNNKGLPDFNLVQRRDHAPDPRKAQRQPATYVVFDILELGGKSLMNLALEERKEILAKAVHEGTNAEVIVFSSDGQKLWNEVIKRKLEGVVAKKRESRYYPGVRSHDWLKIKHMNTIDVVIVGYTSQKRTISSLCMGLYKKGKLTYVGKVNVSQAIDLKQTEIDAPPVVNPPAEKGIHWLKPVQVAEVTYQQMTPYEQLRVSQIQRLRDDKDPKDCTWEQL